MAREDSMTPVARTPSTDAGVPARAPTGGVTSEGRIIRLDSLMLTYHASTRETDALKRRFMTLSVVSGASMHLRGGVGYVVKAESMGSQGEFFALKRLKVPVSGVACADNPQAAQLAASFRQEYDVHRVLSPTGLVPELYGYARIGGEPAILMEWVDGITLHDAAKQLCGADGKVPLEVVADIGISVLAALRRIEFVDEGLVHRDLSPLNIMIRTGKRPLQDQVEAGIYDICLIDFGSATMEQETSSSFTMAENFWRGATPGYAPPEMLDRESGDVAGKRRSHAIDVYALCSVLYELYTGHVPYETAKRAERAIYEMKTTEPPRPVELREEDGDGSLKDAIMQGLAADQDARPTAEALAGELQGWEEAHGTSRPWAQTFGALARADATAASKTPASLSPTILEMPGTSSAGTGSAEARERSKRPSFRKRHPRLMAGFAVAAVVVVAVVVAGSLTRWFGFGPVQVRDSVNDYSWDELSWISRQIGDAQSEGDAMNVERDYHLVNDAYELDGTQTKDVTLEGGTQTSVVITGFRHDTRSDDPNRKAGIAFSFTEPVDKQPMSSEKTKVRSWETTALRTWLVDDFSQMLPDDLEQKIVRVQKYSIVLTPSDGNGDNVISSVDGEGDDVYYDAKAETTDDRLWVYSYAEVAQLDANVDDALGLALEVGNARQYELFKNNEVPTEVEQSQLANNTLMYSKTSWLRTPDEETPYGFKNMEKEGDGNYLKGADPTKPLGVVPGFYV